MSNFKNKLTVLATGLVMVFTSYTSTVSADAFEGLSMMRMGAWEVDFSGNVNAFVVSGDCEPDVNGRGVAGGLACGSNGTEYDYGDIRTGLLPAWFNFAASTNTPGGWKTGIHLSFQPGADDNNNHAALGNTGLGGPLGLNSSNFRQIFTTLGHENYGTFKIGRDLGIFGSNAILEDMTLLGVGGTARDLGPGGNTTLGRIGFGYIYADWKSQVQYTTPNMGGFSATFAVTDPWGATSLAGSHTSRADVTAPYSTTNANRPQEEDTFGFEGKLNYAFDAGGGVSGHVWASFITQEVDWKNRCPNGLGVITEASDANTGQCSDSADDGGPMTNGATELFSSENDDDSTAYDIGGKIVVDSFDFVAYYYDGEGLGTTDFLLDGYDRTGEARDSDGYYMQARWRTPVGTLLGISYGESELEETAYDTTRRNADAAPSGNPAVAGPNNYSLVETNDLFVIGAYHPVGEGLNLVLEYSKTNSEAHNGNESEEDSIAVGAIMFF